MSDITSNLRPSVVALTQNDSPFHEGERAIQARLGVESKLAAVGNKIIRNHMPDQHRAFFAELPFIVVGSVGEQRQPWASLLCGPPGFMISPDPSHLHIHALPDEYDPLHALLKDETQVGLLGIQFHTRRRNRMNGTIVTRGDDGFVVNVQQSFGNCPKYIQARYCEYSPTQKSFLPEVTKRSDLDATMQSIIQRADTFFIATVYGASKSDAPTNTQHGVDTSHRGGKSGFVKIDGNSLWVPDYIGNFQFNTLGNLHTHSKAGLLFIDFDNGHLLHLAVDSETIWDVAVIKNFPGAQRVLGLHVTQAILVKRQIPLLWTGWELSTHLSDK